MIIDAFCLFVFYVETRSIVTEGDMTRVMADTTVVPAREVVMHLTLATTSDTTSAPRPPSPPPRPVTESPLIRPQFLQLQPLQWPPHHLLLHPHPHRSQLQGLAVATLMTVLLTVTSP